MKPIKPTLRCPDCGLPFRFRANGTVYPHKKWVGGDLWVSSYTARCSGSGKPGMVKDRATGRLSLPKELPS